MKDVKSLDDGLRDAYDWYIHNSDKVNPKAFIEYIDNNLV